MWRAVPSWEIPLKMWGRRFPMSNKVTSMYDRSSQYEGCKWTKSNMEILVVDLLKADWERGTSSASVRKDLSIMRFGDEVLGFLASSSDVLAGLRRGFQGAFLRI